MNFEIGKVTAFDGYCGKLMSESGEYFFLNEDVESGLEVEIGSLVVFRGEEIQGRKKAYFIKSAQEILKAEKNKEKVYRDL